MKQRGSRIDCPCYTLTVLSQPGRQANMAYRDCTTRQHVVFSHHSLWLFLKSPKSCEISKTWLIWETESMTPITIHTPFWLWAGVCRFACWLIRTDHGQWDIEAALLISPKHGRVGTLQDQMMWRKMHDGVCGAGMSPELDVSWKESGWLWERVHLNL